MRFLALLVTGACVSACGGKVIFDGSTGAAQTTSSSTSGAGGSTGTGGCDAKSHTIDIADFNVTCTVASDCAPVFTGNLCDNCLCPFSAINVADKMKYQAERQAKGVAPMPGGCFCSAAPAICAQGHCATQKP